MFLADRHPGNDAQTHVTCPTGASKDAPHRCHSAFGGGTSRFMSDRLQVPMPISRGRKLGEQARGEAFWGGARGRVDLRKVYRWCDMTQEFLRFENSEIWIRCKSQVLLSSSEQDSRPHPTPQAGSASLPSQAPVSPSDSLV